MPLFGKPQIPGQPLMPNTPPHAPAWRWHGYGSTGSATTQFAVPSPPTSAANTGLNHPDVGSTVLPMPAPVPMPMPTGPVLQNDPRPTSLPSYTPPSSGPIHAVPLPMGSLEPSWKPMDSRSGFFRNPPPLHDAGVTTAHVATTLPADPWIVSRAVFKPSPEPVAATPPEQPPQATTSDEPLVVLRSTIETVIAGRGRDLEMFHRGPNNLLIRWTVRAAVDAEQLANLISKLPEIAPYHVTYEIAVAP
jgi:hypothetical protein